MEKYLWIKIFACYIYSGGKNHFYTSNRMQDVSFSVLILTFFIHCMKANSHLSPITKLQIY